MNYFRVQSALIAGVQAIPITVESAQSRRLPYLQILGGSGQAAAELKERVVAALHSARLRVPARRITVQLLPGAHGLPLEHLDLAVALAILGGNGQFPASRVENLLVCAGLGLDGGLRPAANSAALRRLLAAGEFRSALLPWEGSEILSGAQLGAGGGFRTLGEVVSFLRGEIGAAKAEEGAEREAPEPSRVWEKIPGQPVAKRLLEVAAAGLHHSFLPGPASARADLLAHALSSLLPPLGAAEAEEVRAIYGHAGLDRGPSRPFHSFGAATGLPPLLPDRSLAKVGEALLAHRGVLYVENVVEHEAKLFPALLAPMRRGRFELSLANRRAFVPAEPLVLAHTGLCACGGLGSLRSACVCRPTEARRFRERWCRLLRYPFDLFLRLEPAGVPAGAEEPPEARATRVEGARALALSRQGRPNGRLTEAEALGAKAWAPGALSLLTAWEGRAEGRDLAPLLRVALTISDLRAAHEVGERDLFEARHYFFLEPGDAGAAGPPGRTEASSSAPETNSIPMP